MGWVVRYFRVSDEWEDTLRIAVVVLNKAVHILNRTRNALLVGVIKSEAHTEHDAALKTLTHVSFQLVRVAVSSAVKEKGANEVDVCIIELLLPLKPIQASRQFMHLALNCREA